MKIQLIYTDQCHIFIIKTYNNIKNLTDMYNVSKVSKKWTVLYICQGQKEQTLSLKDWFRLCHRSHRALVVLPGFMIVFLVSSFDTNSFFVSNFIFLLKADESIHHIKLRQSCLCMYTFWFFHTTLLF